MLKDWEVLGFKPDRVKLKTLKMTLTATLCDAPHWVKVAADYAADSFIFFVIPTNPYDKLYFNKCYAYLKNVNCHDLNKRL